VSKAIENLTEAMKVAAAGRPRGGRFPTLGRSPAESRRNAQCMVAAILPKPLPDEAGSSHHAGRPSGQWGCRCTSLR